MNKTTLNKIKLKKLNYSFLCSFVKKKLNFFESGNKKLTVKRDVNISNIFTKYTAYAHQGRVWVKIKLIKQKVGMKVGMFAATKKPFNFRPKKKKEKR